MVKTATSKLDASQRDFCESTARYIRLLAPAGCGKTLALAHRCLHLLQLNPEVKPRFLVVVFTRAARDEFRSRLMTDPIFRPLLGCIEVLTLNQWGFRRLKTNASSPQLLTESKQLHFAMKNDLRPVWMRHEWVRAAVEVRKGKEAKKLFETLDGFKSIGFDHLRDRTFKKFQDRVASFERQGLTRFWIRLLETLCQVQDIGFELRSPQAAYCPKNLKLVYVNFFKFWCEAVEHLSSMCKFTLEDQKYQTYQLEMEHLGKKKLLSGAVRIHHLLVDEFQDINALDLALLKCIAERNQSSVTLVGDDDQAIFEWRGATPRYISEPEIYFGKDFETHILSTNYRSPRNIVAHSQKLIARNKLRVEKRVVPKKKMDAEIELMQCVNVNDSIERVVREYRRLDNLPDRRERLAVIARKRAQILPIQIHLASQGIEFCAADDLQIFLSHAFEELISLLELKKSCEEQRRPGLVLKDLFRLTDLVKRFPINKDERNLLIAHLEKKAPESLLEATDVLAAYRCELKGDNRDGAMSRQFAEKIRLFLTAETVSASLNVLAEEFDGLQKDFGKAEEDVFFTDPPFSQLAQYAERFGADYEAFVHAMERAKETLAKTPGDIASEFDLSHGEGLHCPIHLLTAQRAKGREFDTVILLDANEGYWPCRQACEEVSHMEEERRLFYVAMTRAKNRLIATVQHDATGHLPMPSRFIEEANLMSKITPYSPLLARACK